MAIEQLVENMVNSGETSGAWRVLVTGGSGLVGKAIEKHVNQLSASGGDANHWYFASSKDADLCDFEQTKALFEREKPTHVVHLAAKVGGLFANLDGNIQFLRDNLAMNDNVIKLCHDYDVKNAIFCLSTCIFPAEVELPMTEDDIHKGSPHPSNQGYAHAKRILEVLVRLHRETYGHNWMCLIPTNVYGPHDNFHLVNSHVIPALIHKCYLAKRDGTQLQMFGTGKPLRQFIHSHDFARVVHILLEKLSNPEQAKSLPPSVILCGDDDSEKSIYETCEWIAKGFNFKGEIRTDPSKSDGIFRKTASNEKLRKILPADFKFMNLQEGMADACQWFAKAYEAGEARV